MSTKTSITALTILMIGAELFAAAKPSSADLPGRNDVTMRTLRFRDVPPGDLMDPFQAIKQFHANRMEWVYLDDWSDREKAQVKKVLDAGLLFGGSAGGQLDCWIGDKTAPDWKKKIATLDLNGNPVVLPHHRKWAEPHLIGDVSNPDYLRGHVEYYNRYVDLGATALQRDDAQSTSDGAVQKYGAGFTETGLAGFRVWLKKNLTSEELATLGITDVDHFDYGDYLRKIKAPAGDDFERFKEPIKPYWLKYWKEVAVDFYTRLFAEVRAHAGRPIPFSCNNTSFQIWDSITSLFDFGISELLAGTANPSHIWERSLATRKLGKVQVFGTPKTRGEEVDPVKKTILARKSIATAYASGSLSQVPWDLYEQTADGLGRYFGKPEDYADLYAFVRAQDWSHYEECFAAGADIKDPRNLFKTVPAAAEGGNGGVYLFINRPVSGTKGPVHVHLVDWGVSTVPAGKQTYITTDFGERIYYSSSGEMNLNRSAPAPFALKIDPEALELTGEIKGTLLTPAPYGQEAAVIRRALEFRRQDKWLVADLPALTPWGIVELGN